MKAARSDDKSAGPGLAILLSAHHSPPSPCVGLSPARCPSGLGPGHRVTSLSLPPIRVHSRAPTTLRAPKGAHSPLSPRRPRTHAQQPSMITVHTLTPAGTFGTVLCPVGGLSSPSPVTETLLPLPRFQRRPSVSTRLGPTSHHRQLFVFCPTYTAGSDLPYSEVDRDPDQSPGSWPCSAIH